MTPMGQQAKAAAEDQRIIDIAGMIKHRAIDRGDAHLIAIVAYPAYYARSHATRSQNASRQRLHVRLWWSKTQHICAGNRLRRHAQHVADHPTHACVRATKWLDSGRMIMRLY